MAQPESIAVVGAGPGGLAVAMLLAAKGRRVKVYEAEQHIGGRTSRLTLGSPEGDFHFDRGPTFFLMPYVLEEIFSAAGLSLTGSVELTRLDPMYRLIIGRTGREPVTLDATQDCAEMSRRLALLDPRDGPGFERFMDATRRKLEVFTPILRRGFRTALDLLKPDVLRAAPWLNPHQSVHTHLGKYFHSREARLALTFQSKYLGMSPLECPSLFSILPFIEYEYGVWHPRGGCNALMTAMALACRRLGVEFALSTPVEGICFDGQRATGVRTAGDVHPHEHVVLNADASWALRNLIPAAVRRGIPRASDESLERMRYSCSTFMLYLGLKGALPLAHHTIRISGAYEENLADIGAGRLSADPSLYVHNPSALDPTLAPSGSSSLYVLVPTPNLKTSAGRIDWALEAPALRARTLRAVSDLTGRDIEPLITAERMTTPRDWGASNIAFGATFNLAHSLDQMLHRRPQHELPGVRGVWLVGGGTHPGSGLPVIFLSAQIAAARLLGVTSPMGTAAASRHAWPPRPVAERVPVET
ncbi:MAG: phytoene desaturase family protein [Phycisphaerales bacterium]